MQTIHLIQSLIEFIAIVGIILGFIFEDHLVRWEDKLWRKMKRRVISVKRNGK